MWEGSCREDIRLIQPRRTSKHRYQVMAMRMINELEARSINEYHYFRSLSSCNPRKIP